MMYVHERYFVVGEYLNHQTQRSYGKSFDLIPDCKRYRILPKSPVRAMVFVVIWPAGRSDLVLLPSGFKTISVTYIENSLNPLLPSLPPYLYLKKIIFLQDLASAHRAKKTQPFLD